MAKPTLRTLVQLGGTANNERIETVCIRGRGSGFWKHGLLLTLLFGFTVMLVGGASIYKTKAPVPESVVDPAGATLFTARDVQSGQELFP